MTLMASLGNRMIDHSHFSALLIAKQAELENRLRPDSDNNESMKVEYVADEIDNIVERQRREAAIRENDRNSKMLRQVKMALRRINEGIFGICFDCEEEIPEKRLKALPWAERCVKCQEIADLEQKSGVLVNTLEELA